MFIKPKRNIQNRFIQTSTVKKMRDLLSGVVNLKGSTGYPYHMDDIRLIGKTGTGQVAKDGRYRSNYYTNSFVGLAPYDDPEVVVVLWYQSYAGSAVNSAKVVNGVCACSFEIKSMNNQ